MRDQEIISSIRAGSTEAIKTFYLDNKVGFKHFIQKNSQMDQELIEDIYQDAFIALIENIQRGKLDQLNSSLKTYLFSIGKFMMYKKSKNGLWVDDVLWDQLWLYDDSGDTEEQEELIQLIQKKFYELSEACQRILKMTYYEGKKAEEILSEGSYSNKDVIKSQKSRCLALLKKLVHGK